MNYIDRLRRALQNPKLFIRGINRAYYQRGGIRSENPDGVDIFEEDWDTLVLLDACRYDMFKSTNEISGDLSTRTSKGSSTIEWLRGNFDGRNLRDTIYITSNPQLERNRDSISVNLYKTINVWLEDGWDEDTGTVRAETLTKRAIDVHNTHPQKRIIVHYMQPHYPFVESETEFDKNHLNQINNANDSTSGENIWNQKFMNRTSVSDEYLWSIYYDNLKYVLESVSELLDNINGKIIITSDHGNYVGERAFPIPIHEYGHPRGIYDEPLIRIPWLVHINGQRRSIKTGTPETTSQIESEVAISRLKDLGYK